MTNSKNTKRALFSSMIALLLCFTMLLGTTFAWFTDSASTGRNIIQSGNLDVVLEYKTSVDGEWTPVTENTKLFKEGALYEPGYTEVVFLRVSNAGSLALKYNLNVNVYGETTSTNVNDQPLSLKDYLEIGYYCMDESMGQYLLRPMFGTRDSAIDSVNAQDGSGFSKISAYDGIVCKDQPLVASTSTNYSPLLVAIVLTMPTTVGNEANHKTGVAAPTIDLGVTLLATQYTDENDSFGNQYDKDAEYESAVTKVGNYADFLAAIAEGGAIQLTSNIVVEDVSTVISKDTTIALNGKTITGTRAYDGSNAATAAVLTVSGAEVTLIGAGKVENTTIDDVQNYAILVDGGGKVIINDGTYIADDSAVYVRYGEAIIKGGFFEAHSATSPAPDYTETWGGTEYTSYLAAVVNCSKDSYINFKDGKLDGMWANVDVSGGTFVNEDPSNLKEGWNIEESHVIDGYKVVREEKDNGDAWYTVVAE